MLRIQFRRADTCRCEWFEAWDDEVAPESRTHTFRTQAEAEDVVAAYRTAKGLGPREKPQPPISACTAHAALGHTPARMAAVVDESQRKNILPSIAASVFASITLDNIRWQWVSDANRTLLISFVGVTVSGARKAQIQAACDTQFGPGKVSVT